MEISSPLYSILTWSSYQIHAPGLQIAKSRPSQSPYFKIPFTQIQSFHKCFINQKNVLKEAFKSES